MFDRVPYNAMMTISDIPVAGLSSYLNPFHQSVLDDLRWMDMIEEAELQEALINILTVISVTIVFPWPPNSHHRGMPTLCANASRIAISRPARTCFMFTALVNPASLK